MIPPPQSRGQPRPPTSILSGSPGSVAGGQDEGWNTALFTLDVPILGLCYGQGPRRWPMPHLGKGASHAAGLLAEP